VVFFIFIISNAGGCLTPIGDPPLFLGYLKGIPFWWVLEHCWMIWLVGVGMLLAIFFVVDSRNYRRVPKPVRQELAEPKDQWRAEGLSNLFFLGVILASVFISKPLFLREGLMVASAIGSYLTTKKHVHQANHFGWHPIQEVAILFVGIFATMMPALDYLQLHAGGAGHPTPGLFYWGSGMLSSVLDNAPTYLSFLSATTGASAPPDLILQVQQLLAAGVPPDLAAISGPNADSIRYAVMGLQKYHAADLAAGQVTSEMIGVCLLLGDPKLNQFIVAVSVGAVFFGANTYIGNGPNFMVKAIAEHQKAHAPTFLGYVFKFTLPVMLPVLLVLWLLFFR
jgi:Na+/H+ antiporter NhaD/arsenite permease-like protein